MNIDAFKNVVITTENINSIVEWFTDAGNPTGLDEFCVDNKHTKIPVAINYDQNVVAVVWKSRKSDINLYMYDLRADIDRERLVNQLYVFQYDLI